MGDDKLIRNLTAASSVASTDYVVIDQGSGAAKRATLAQIVVAGASSATGVYNVLDYGTNTTPGTTDMTTAIQAAINACTAGGTVFVPAGTYKVTGLTISKPMILEGAGYGNGELLNGNTGVASSTLQFTETSGAAITIDAVAANAAFGGVQIRDLKLTGNRTVGGATTGTGIKWNADSTRTINGVEMSGVTIRDFLDYGEHIVGNVFQFMHLGCHFTRNGNAQVRVEHSGAFLPSEISFFGCVFDSEAVTNSGPATADGLQLDVSGGDCVKCYACSFQQCVDGVSVEHGGVPYFNACHFEVNTNGFHSSNIAHSKLEKCYFVLNTKDGLVDTTGDGFVLFEECVFSGSEQYIELTAYSTVVIRSEKILHSYGTGGFYNSAGSGYMVLEDVGRRTLIPMAFSATPEFDAEKGHIFDLTLTDNVTSSTIVNGVAGVQITLMLYQDGVGSRTFAWPADALLAGGSISLSGANKCDVVTFIYNGAKWVETGRSQNM